MPADGSSERRDARRVDAGGIALMLAFAALCAAAVVAEGRLFRFFFAFTGACGLVVAAILGLRERVSGWLAGARIKDDLRDPAASGHWVHGAGLLILVAAGAAALLAGMPTVWYFPAAAIGGGLVVAAVMHRAHR